MMSSICAGAGGRRMYQRCQITRHKSRVHVCITVVLILCSNNTSSSTTHPVITLYDNPGDAASLLYEPYHKCNMCKCSQVQMLQ